MSKWILIVAAAAVSPAWPADGGIVGPVSGFIADGHGGAIRAIEGLPGAARMGAAVRLPFTVSSAAIASRQDYALAIPVGGDGRPVLVRGLRADAPETVAIESAIAASTMLLSRSGRAALLYSGSDRKLQFVTGLPAAPQTMVAVEVADASALALDSDGTTALLAAADGQIYAIRQDAAPRAIARLEGVSSIAMLPGRNAAVAASGTTGDIILIEELTGAASIRTLAGASAGIEAPRSIEALTSESAGVIVADGRLATVDIATGSVEWIPLAGAAEKFESLDSGLFALNRPGARPLLMMDANRGHSAWFVPPDRNPTIQRAPVKPRFAGEDRPY